MRVARVSSRSAAPLMPLLDGLDFSALRETLTALGADGWLLYDFRKVNPIAARILGDTGMGTRRLFVLLPRSGRPVAVAHRIELQPLADFPGEVRPYGSWGELHRHLEALVRGRTLAIEISPRDQVPYLDRVPYGVVQLLESFGARLVSSAPLVSQFAASWSAAELTGHRRAAESLATIARDALSQAGREAARGVDVRETGVTERVREAITRAGLWTNEGPIVAFGPSSAVPHYEPHPGADRRLEAGDVVLLDLWAGPGRGSVFADQTWMGFAGRSPDTDVRRVWQAVKGARDAAVNFLRERWRPDRAVSGAEVDDAARAVIRDAGFADFFVHRTGHSIDRELHGSGPHIDNFETEDARALVPGVGFSVEPGVYLPGRFGMRSEINVYIDAEGPEVNPHTPQDELILV
jgi:Xaa-Pro dipeptidase